MPSHCVRLAEAAPGLFMVRLLGGSGMDEISLLGETEVHEVKGDSLESVLFVSGSTWVSKTIAPRIARRRRRAECARSDRISSRIETAAPDAI